MVPLLRSVEGWVPALQPLLRSLHVWQPFAPSFSLPSALPRTLTLSQQSSGVGVTAAHNGCHDNKLWLIGQDVALVSRFGELVANAVDGPRRSSTGVRHCAAVEGVGEGVGVGCAELACTGMRQVAVGRGHLLVLTTARQGEEATPPPPQRVLWLPPPLQC